MLKHAEIMEFVKAGVPYKSIAKRYNTTASTISRIARDHGVYKLPPEYIAPSLSHTGKENIEWRERFCKEWTAATERIKRYLP